MTKTHLFGGVSVCIDMQKLSKSGGSKTHCNLIGSSTADWYLVQLNKTRPRDTNRGLSKPNWCSKETLGKSLR